MLSFLLVCTFLCIAMSVSEPWSVSLSLIRGGEVKGCEGERGRAHLQLHISGPASLTNINHHPVRVSQALTNL